MFSMSITTRSTTTMHIHHRFLLTLTLASATILCGPTLADEVAKAPPREPAPMNSKPMGAKETPESMLGQMEQEFAEEEARLGALKEEAQKRKDDSRMKAVEQMSKELMERRALKMAELKAKLGEEGFARAKAKWDERKAKADMNKDGKVDKLERNKAMKADGKRADRNRDGKVSGMEKQRAKEMKKDMRTDRRDAKKESRDGDRASKKQRQPGKDARTGPAIKAQSKDRPKEDMKKEERSGKKSTGRGDAPR
jgi:hypothetical protein